MKYYLTKDQAQRIDRYTQEEIGIPGIVLMEKAAERLADGITAVLSQDAWFDKNRDRILAVTESGNNGGDAVAVMRILKTKGYHTAVFEIGGITSATESYDCQKKIAKRLGVEFPANVSGSLNPADYAEVFEGYRVLVDGIFGVGLSREIKGVQKAAVEAINSLSGKSRIIGCDIPSGIDASTGKILGCAVKCDVTVTFQYVKYGMLFGEGRKHSGEIRCEEIGLCLPDAWMRQWEGSAGKTHESSGTEPPEKDGRSTVTESAGSDAGSIAAEAGEYRYFEYTKEECDGLKPQRKPDSNKGSCGKVLIVAGSDEFYGALYLSATAAYRTGAGLVRVVTDIKNRDLLMNKIPEAMILTYDTGKGLTGNGLSGDGMSGDGLSENGISGNDLPGGSASGHGEEKDGKDNFANRYKDAIQWADVILIGPGLGVGKLSEGLLNGVLLNARQGQKVVLDADALNLISAGETRKQLTDLTDRLGPDSVVLTPHMAEMVRLLSGLKFCPGEDYSVSGLAECRAAAACGLSDRCGVICVLKDARTIVTKPEDGRERFVYVNTTGNSGMSKGGSGDVLAGMIAGLLAQNKDGRGSSYGIVCAAVQLHGRAGDAAKDVLGEERMLAGDIITGYPG